MNDIAKLLIIAGAGMLLAGGMMLILSRAGVGKLPGDIVIRRGNFTFYFPIVTSIILSIALSLLFAFFRRR